MSRRPWEMHTSMYGAPSMSDWTPLARPEPFSPVAVPDPLAVATATLTNTRQPDLSKLPYRLRHAVLSILEAADGETQAAETAIYHLGEWLEGR